MSAPQKLTKKQRKGLAFRQNRGKGKKAEPDELGADVPVVENVDEEETTHALANDIPDIPPRSAGGARNAEAEDVDQGTGKSLKVKKRKREEEESVQTQNTKKQKKTKESAKVATEQVVTDEKSKASKQNQRFILFVGNLKYTTTKEAILEHFSACDPPPVVRLLTPKKATTAKSKGCAFLEFSHKNSLQQALKLHQSKLEGREINVELTSGGGGKSDTRLEKLKSKNRELASQRDKRVQKERKTADGAGDVEVTRPQRHSTTSGVEQKPVNKRTWSIPDVDDGQTHRGGQKHAKGDKKRGKPSKAFGTGVNAIPVG